MSNLGVGVMIERLYGGAARKTAAAMDGAVGQTIASIAIDPDANAGDGALLIELGDRKLSIFDGGRSCCEARYMTTDDDLAAFVGAKLVDIEEREGPETPAGEWGEEHETAFLVIRTSAGDLTVTTHNEHNGYYGGFSLQADVMDVAE